MNATVPETTDNSAGWPAKHTEVEVDDARRRYRIAREYDLEGCVRYALMDVVRTDADPGWVCAGSTQNTLRDVLGGVAPERRWALAGELARLGHALRRLPWNAAHRERGALVQALAALTREAAAAHMAGLRFLFGGVR